MDDKQLFELAQKVSLIPYAFATSNPRTNDKLWLHDLRKEEVNPFYGQTQSGLFLEVYYGIPGNIWTPWGMWNCWGSGSGWWNQAMNKILDLVGAEVYKPLVRNTWGEFGPIYAMTRVNGVELPKAVERPRGEYLEYEAAKAAWRSFSN